MPPHIKTTNEIASPIVPINTLNSKPHAATVDTPYLAIKTIFTTANTSANKSPIRNLNRFFIFNVYFHAISPL